MAQWSFPFADSSGDRVYGDADFALFYENLFTSGVIATVGNALKVEQPSSGGMNVVVKSGAAILKGRQFYNTEDLAINVPVASTSQNRTDSVVVRLDVSSRAITLAYKQGDVSVQRDEVVHELQLATIDIGKNTVNVFNSNITDKRSDKSACGYSSPYEKVSVSGLEQQYKSLLQQTFELFELSANDNEADLQQLLTDQQTIFQTWLSGLQSQLDENQVGNLQGQIDKLSPKYTLLTITHNLGRYPTVNALYWEYGLGTVPLEEQPEGISWDGTSPETITVRTVHISRNKLEIKVPINQAMSNPIIEAKSANEIHLTEGIKSIMIQIN